MSDEKTAETPKAAPKKTTATGAKKAPAKKAPAKKSAPARASAAKPAARKTAPKKSAATQAAAEKAPVTAKASLDDTKAHVAEPAEQTAHSNAHSQEETSNNDSAQLFEELKGRNWPQIIKRALLMFFFGVLGTIALYLAFVLAFAQVVSSIFIGEPNKALTNIMHQCSGYIRDVVDYLSFASDECPYPFGRDLPNGN